MRLLLIDDDHTLVATLSGSLKKLYALDIAYTAKAGEYLATVNDYDVILLDFNLPDNTGVTLCQTLREDENHVPILMLTGRTEVADKVQALDSGADDYVLKPFSTPELLARVRALLRRTPLLVPHNVLTHREISMNLNSGVVRKNNQPIILRRKEFQILEYLMRNRGQIINRERLLEHIWSGDSEPNANSIDVHIKQLRRKLDPNSRAASSFIKSIYGFGYQLN